MRRATALTLPLILALAASGCGGSKEEEPNSPRSVSIGPPPDQAPPPSTGMPPGHPPMGATREGPPPAEAPSGAPDAARFKVPEGWQAEAPSSGMRLLQYRLPRAEGDSRDGEVAVFANIKGDAKANIDRWRGQFAEVVPGKDSVSEEAEGLRGRVSILDITGKYAGQMGPAGKGAPAEETRLIGAVVEDPEGVYFIKAVGPPGTVAKWEKSIRDFVLASARK